MQSVRLRGKLIKGRGEGAQFTEVPWAKAAFTRILGFEPYPGTLNLRIDPSESGDALRIVREAEGFPMPPPEGSGFCSARCLRARLGPDLAAGLVIPEVEGYYEDVLEVLAPVNVQEAMGVSEGDTLEVEVFLRSESGVEEG